MVHAIYPGAIHDRFTHSIGVVEIVDRMIGALSRNATYRKDYGERPDSNLPTPSDEDRFTIRLAALLHDIGHGPFSHASEDLVEERNSEEFDNLNEIFRAYFEGARGVKPSEAFAILLIISEALQCVLGHPRFTIPVKDRSRLPVSIVALLLGSRGGKLEAPYLYELISGPIDADKLDYMARDSFFTGLPLGIDVTRLIRKLEIVRITPVNAINEELVKRAQEAPENAVYEMGISLAGLTAYEQMIVGRAMLYDRVYYHHKVRCAEAMLRKLFRIAETERGRPFSVEELYSDIPDDAMILLLGGQIQVGDLTGGGEASQKLASRIRTRKIFHRAFAFAARFFGCLDSLKKTEKQDTLAALWEEIFEALSTPEACTELENQIVATANCLLEKVPEIPADIRHVDVADLIVDLPEDRVTAGSRTLPMRTEGGRITSANLFFSPDKWSEAYKSQKQCGFVFAHNGLKEVIWLASQIVFFKRFGAVMSEDAHYFCKTDKLVGTQADSWMEAAALAGVCSTECAEALKSGKPQLLRFREKDIVVPNGWTTEDEGVVKRLAQGFFDVLPGGVIASIRDAVLVGLESLLHIAVTFYTGGKFKADTRPDEKRDLQAAILELLRSSGIMAKEGVEVAGGESDILLPGDIIVENKVVGETDDPMSEKLDSGWQARRYSMAFNRRISFIVLAYKPKTEGALLSQPNSVSITALEDCREPHAIVRICIPWGYGSPSSAKRPIEAPGTE
jgi:HD superfamily phosphohydrolase